MRLRTGVRPGEPGGTGHGPDVEQQYVEDLRRRCHTMIDRISNPRVLNALMVVLEHLEERVAFLLSSLGLE